MLSKESIRKLKAVKAAILAQPEFYDQNSWVAKITSCGTTRCIAGWADFLVNGRKSHEARARKLSAISRVNGEWSVCDDWSKVTEQALGITHDQAERITCSSHSWPDGLDDEYDNAQTCRERAIIAGKMIDLFISEGGDI